MYVPGVLNITLVHGGLVVLLQPTRAAWGHSRHQRLCGRPGPARGCAPPALPGPEPSGAGPAAGAPRPSSACPGAAVQRVTGRPQASGLGPALGKIFVLAVML